ncbi:MAG TPA: adenylate/guanylate cyclase domain-containing protein, partial [Bacteroidota bacterium]|nr:adenylate/guanylate cyclase domain-containing protein [Bacteroidota bacterium]
MQTHSSRKIVALMFTDIVGFSRQMGSNEDLTLKKLEIHHKIIRESIHDYAGNEIKTIGDAFLVEFESSVKAIHCAVEIQKKFHEYNSERSQQEAINVRIGIHVGDITMTNGDILGDGVNIASRIQPLADPGGICISQDVANQIRGKFELPL